MFGDTIINIPFNYNEESKLFFNAIIEISSKSHKDQMFTYISEDNVHKLYHGKGWGRINAEGEDRSVLKPISVSLSVEKESIIKNDISKMFDFMSEFTKSFTSQVVGNMFSSVSEACDKTGNIVKQSDCKSQADMFLESLKKVEFSVDENGKVKLPSLHMGSDTVDSFMKEIEAQPPEFMEEVELIQKQKTDIALECEKIRLSKFKSINCD